jgi:DNA-binding response OmpR family regulator
MGLLSGKDRSIHSLIVDDDASIGGILKELVSRDGVFVHVFTDGRGAIDFVTKQSPDIVITDLMMANADGLEVLRHAKKANRDAVVIIITGHASLETAIEAVKEGADDYIKKPFKLREMEIVFDKAVEKVRLVRRNKELLLELKEANDQLVAAKRENTRWQEEGEKKEEKGGRLQFFSSSLPTLEFFQEANESQHRLFDKLEKIAQLKKDRLLTEEEFGTLKTHIIESLKMFKV